MSSRFSAEFELFLKTNAPQFERELKGIKKEIDALEKKAQGVGNGKEGLFASVLGANFAEDAIKSVGNAIAGIASEMINGNAEMESYRTSFATMLGSMEKANALMDEVKKFGAETPYEFPELADSTRKLLAFGISQDVAVEKLRKIGDIASGVGTPIGELAEIFGKAKVAGTLFGEDINQLVGRGIPIITEFAKQMGVSESEVKKLASEGKITFDMLDTAFTNLTSDGGQFSGMMEAQSLTFNGLMSTLQDNLGELTRTIGGPFFDAAKEGLIYVMEWFQKDDVKAMFGELREAVANLMDKFDDPKVEKAITALMTGLTWIGTKGIEFVSTFIDIYAEYVGAWLDAADAIGLLSISSENAAAAQEKLVGQQIDLNQKQQESEKNIQSLVSEYENLAKKGKLTSEEENKRSQILWKLNNEYPGYIKSTNDYKEALDGVRQVGEASTTSLGKLTEEYARLEVAQKQAIRASAEMEIVQQKNNLAKDNWSWKIINASTIAIRSAKSETEVQEALGAALERNVTHMKNHPDDADRIARSNEALSAIADARIKLIQTYHQEEQVIVENTKTTQTNTKAKAEGAKWSEDWFGKEIKRLQEQQNLLAIGTGRYKALGDEIRNLTGLQEAMKSSFDESMVNFEDIIPEDNIDVDITSNALSDEKISEAEDKLKRLEERWTSTNDAIAGSALATAGALGQMFSGDLEGTSLLKQIAEAAIGIAQTLILAADAALVAKGISTWGVSLIQDAPLIAAAYGALEILKGYVSTLEFASGTPQVPRDQIAKIHKDEMIIPATFAEAIRSGQITLGGGQTGNVQGKVKVDMHVSRFRDAVRYSNYQLDRVRL